MIGSAKFTRKGLGPVLWGCPNIFPVLFVQSDVEPNFAAGSLLEQLQRQREQLTGRTVKLDAEMRARHRRDSDYLKHIFERPCSIIFSNISQTSTPFKFRELVPGMDWQ